MEYGSEADLIRRVRIIESKMAAAEGGPTIRKRQCICLEGTLQNPVVSRYGQP